MLIALKCKGITLEIDLNYKLTFENHINKICEKASQKLNPLPQDLHVWPLKSGD